MKVAPFCAQINKMLLVAMFDFVYMLFTFYLQLLATVNCNFNDFLTVAKFKMFLICNLIRIACRLCLCCSCLLIKIIKYCLGQKSTKFHFIVGSAIVCHV